jgi:allophanate hydrolase
MAPASSFRTKPGADSPAWIHRLAHPLALRTSPAGPLQGLRFAVKDNIDVKGLPTTAACPDYAYIAPQSATVVQRLLEAGAQLVGKTNLDQFACGLNGTRSPYGVVPNTFDPTRICGGSSSGSAYVVARGEVDFALGTDTAGSGRVPAGLNNIVGLKPTRGAISAAGVVPAARSVDTVSIFASSVPLAWRVLEAAAAPDRADPYSRPMAWRLSPFPAALRVGIPDVLEFAGDELAAQAFSQAQLRLRAWGAMIKPVPWSALRDAAALLYESALVAERHAAIRPFFDAHESQVIEPVRSIIAQARRYSATEVFEAQARLKALAAQANAMWDDIDVLLVPTAPCHPSIQAVQAQPVELNRLLGTYTNFVNLLDYAALAVPSSMRADGLPFGVTFIAPAGSDWALAELGTRYHAASGLPCGASDTPLSPAGKTPPPPPQVEAQVQLAVVGAHLSGMPLNPQLIERGARLLERTQTAPCYRLYALPTDPPKPGLMRVNSGGGAGIELEIWSVPLQHYGSFVALIPAPLGIGRIELRDGRLVQGFLCEPHALEQAAEITQHGGWRAYLASLQGA